MGSAQALTYREALDASAWLQRFTPRTAQSPWSKLNRARAEALIAAGTMAPPGLAEVERARRDGRWKRAYDGARTSAVPADLATALARDDRARAFFEALDGANRYAILYRVRWPVSPLRRPPGRARSLGLGSDERLDPNRGPWDAEPMTQATRKLLEEIEALPDQERSELVAELARKIALAAHDLPTDTDLAASADRLFSELDRRESPE